MAQTLDDVVLEQMQTNETLKRVDRNLDNFITLWFANKMDEMEMMRERIAPPVPAAPAEDTKPKDDVKGLDFGLGFLVAGVAAAVLGFAAGIGDALNAGLKLFKIDLGAKFIAWGAKFKAIFSAEGAIGKAVAKVGTFFKPMTDFFGRIGAFLGKGGVIGKVFAKIGGFFQPIVTFVKGFGATFAKFFGFFRVLGRVFLPLTAAIEVGMAIFKELTSLGDGADILDKFFSIAKGIQKGLANIVLIPLDLIKDGVSWLMKKMGFSNFSKLLDKFSFSDSFGILVDTMFNVIEGFGRGAVAALAVMFKPGASMSDAFMKEWSNVMNGGSGSVPKVETTAQGSIDADGNIVPVSKKVSGGRGGRTNLAEMTPETLTQSIVTANKKSTADRLSKSSMREEVTGSIAKGTVTAGEGATVNITNVSNVNAPTTTQNNVSSGTSRRESRSLSPVHNNGYLSSAYSF
jgi:hypothetical protein